MGRPRKPTKLKIEHIRPSRDKLNIDSDNKDLPVLDILDKEALPIYKDLIRLVKDMGLSMESDAYNLSILANNILEYRRLTEKIASGKENYLVKDSNGNLRRNPLFHIRNQVEQNILSVNKLYGFSPIHRAGLPIEYEKAREDSKKESKFRDKWGNL